MAACCGLLVARFLSRFPENVKRRCQIMCAFLHYYVNIVIEHDAINMMEPSLQSGATKLLQEKTAQ